MTQSKIRHVDSIHKGKKMNHLLVVIKFFAIIW